MSEVALSLPSLKPNGDEVALVEKMLGNLARHEVSNMLKQGYYLGEQRVKQLNIAIPPALSKVNVVVGWAGMTVDVLAERLGWNGWRAYDGNDFGLGDVYRQNELDIEVGLATKDALIYGTSFLVVGAGFTGEPNPLITVESARSMTALRDNRTRRLSAALGINGRTDGHVDDVTLYLPNKNMRLVQAHGVWVTADLDEHNLGRVLVAQMVNNPTGSNQAGRSEMTKAIRSLVDQGVRTMMGMEINREFYSFPQRYMMGADLDMFTDDDGNPVPGWEFVMTNLLVAPVNEEGHTPTAGQFTAASPAPYLDQLKGLAQMVAAEAAIPATYLGFQTDNPPSGDAARTMESRLINRAENRQRHFGRALTEAGRLALLVRDGAIPEGYDAISSKWSDPATPTRSAAADEATKLIGSGVLPADSTVTYDRLGLTPDEQRQLTEDKRRASAQSNLANLAAFRESLEAESEAGSEGTGSAA